MVNNLTTTQLLGAAAEVLATNGYTGVPVVDGDSQQTFATRTFEDRYGIVALCVFDTWQSLIQDWSTAQGQLASTISESVRSPEPKAWEGYLVLMTPSFMPTHDQSLINRMRADTNRVRKLVATGEELSTLEDIRTFLLPLVPLAMDESLSGARDLLSSLPELLLAEGVPVTVTETVLEAFQANESVFQRLHDSGSTP